MQLPTLELLYHVIHKRSPTTQDSFLTCHRSLKVGSCKITLPRVELIILMQMAAYFESSPPVMSEVERCSEVATASLSSMIDFLLIISQNLKEKEERKCTFSHLKDHTKGTKQVEPIGQPLILEIASIWAGPQRNLINSCAFCWRGYIPQNTRGE